MRKVFKKDVFYIFNWISFIYLLKKKNKKNAYSQTEKFYSIQSQTYPHNCSFYIPTGFSIKNGQLTTEMVCALI